MIINQLIVLLVIWTIVGYILVHVLELINLIVPINIDTTKRKIIFGIVIGPIAWLYYLVKGLWNLISNTFRKFA